ncbi:major facilitator superfamily MFS_1 [Kribbella flavida DSM 17836]|uniref:Major facilitator superfamily MFS_1 n=1 Tax=Kribbella flavida (strain DSM 17836 / JCM 10339 / NBRC 14399) TaxID=479435 RepID=D2PSJ6_KRIFD|nr:MFS transporter [Kribbella flavida]ADB33134.1 major facilitator superfamily MFS_1 [Kribbella flavida DSM 17836]
MVDPALKSARGAGLLAITGTAVVGQLYVSTPLAPEVAHTFPELGGVPVLAVAFGASYAAGFLLLAPLIGHRPARLVMVWSLAALAGATLLAAFAPTGWMLVVARVVQGVAASAYTPAVVSHLGRNVAPTQRGRAAGLIGTCYLSAVVVAQLVGQQGAELVGWRGVLSAFAMVYAVAALAITACLPKEQASRPRLVGYAMLLRLAVGPDLRVISAVSATALGGLVALYGALALTPQLDAVELQRVRWACAPALLLAWYFGKAVTRFGGRRVLLVGLATCAVGDLAACAGWVLGAPVGGLVIAVWVGSLGAAMVIPALMDRVAAADPSGAYGPAVYLFMLFAGATAGGAVATRHPVLGLALAAVHLLAAALVTWACSGSSPREEFVQDLAATSDRLHVAAEVEHPQGRGR